MLPALFALTLVSASPGTTIEPVSREISTASAAEALAPAAARAREVVARGKLDHYGMPPLAERARAAGLDAAALTRLLDDLEASCPPEGPCPELAQEPALQPLLRALAAVGSRADAKLLLRLDTRGIWASSSALEDILTREMASASMTARCAPPSAAELRSARADLGGFLVVRSRGERLVAETPSATELDDLAYFLAAVAQDGPEVGVAAEKPVNPAARPAPATPDPEGKRLRDALIRARARGDIDALARSARAYLERLGFPGPIDVAAEGDWGWGGARFSYVLRDLAEASELRGDFVLADQLYRRANPGGGACGTSVSSLWADQVKGTIRSSEHRGECRLAVAERLLDIDGPVHSWPTTAPREDYGPARLAAAGFDVPRLYRGALLTLHREREPTALRELLGRAPEPLRAPALARLDARGPEAWDARVYAIEGFADTAGRAGLPVLVDLLRVADPELQPRVLAAIGEVAARPASDPCVADEFDLGNFGISSQWSRMITPLGDHCEGSLRLADAAALARSLTPWLASAAPDVREAAAATLGKIGHRAALPALRRLRRDPYQPNDVCRVENGGCNRFYPVREAAAEASTNITRLSAGDRRWRTTAAAKAPAKTGE